MAREKFKWRPHKNESTDARHRGGTTRSVRWTALKSGGLKSLWFPDEGNHIQKRG